MNHLRPVSGEPAQIVAAVREWLAQTDEPEPLVVETSGSTGAPKRVRLSRHALVASADATHARLDGPGRWLLMLPPTYVAGLQVIVRSLVAGTDPLIGGEDVVAAAASMGPGRRYVSLVPTQLRRMLQSREETAALRTFDAVLVGGGRIDPALRQEAATHGVAMVATYGMAETAGGCVYDGLPLDGVALKIDATGRIHLAGPMMFDGYEDDAMTREVFQDGWFATSDVGRLDEDGVLQVLGRIDDMIVSGGLNVPAQAVASMLETHPGVDAVEVVGVPDAEWGQRVVAVVVGDDPGLDELRDLVTPREWAPKQVVLVDALPMLPNGKVDRGALEEIVARA